MNVQTLLSAARILELEMVMMKTNLAEIRRKGEEVIERKDF